MIGIVLEIGKVLGSGRQGRVKEAQLYTWAGSLKRSQEKDSGDFLGIGRRGA